MNTERIVFTPVSCCYTGAPGLIWLIFWWLLIHDNPESHPRITREELDYIKASGLITRYNGKARAPCIHYNTTQ